MKYLIWIVVLAVAAVVVADAARNPAYILLVYPPYRTEMSLNLFLLALVVLFVVSYSILRLAQGVIRLPETVRLYRSQRAQVEAQTLLSKACLALLETRYADAEQLARRASGLEADSILPPLIAAQAALEQGLVERCQDHLAEANRRPGECQTACAMLEARLLLQQRQPQAALDKLQTIEKQHSGVLSLLLQAEQQLNHHDQVLALLPRLQQQQLLAPEQLQQLSLEHWQAKIQQADDAAVLQQIRQTIPAELKQQSSLLASLVKAHLALGLHEEAMQLLLTGLESVWDETLLLLYAECQVADPLTQLGRAEKWLPAHPNDATLLLVLGRLCMAQALWGKAQSYLEASNSIAPRDEVYLQLGKLAELTERPQQALVYYQKVMQKYLG